MFPLVPYHNLPRLHELVKADMPTPYTASGSLAGNPAAVLRQMKDPAYYVKRELPTPTIRPTRRQRPRMFSPPRAGR